MARILVGMSGGVDSAVAAYLLKQQGHEVIGAFMKNWEEQDEDGVCTSQRDWEDVQDICNKIDIPYYSVNFVKDYWDNVFTYFLEEYKRGRTPNPDVLCNREIKFKVFLEFADKMGADKLATGHFAQLDHTPKGVRLLRGADPNKDQTYFLYMVKQQQLARAIFPVGGMTKSQVRSVAEEIGLPVAKKRDSTGICFIGERNFRKFLAQYLPAQPGEMRTPDGQIVGRHDGLMYYTLGQRKGIGIGGKGTGEPWFVLEKDIQNNVLVVAQGDDHPGLYTKGALTEAPYWTAGQMPADEFECTAKTRYRQPDQACRVRVEDNGLRVTFVEKQRAVTPGQSLVLYQGDVCLGGGIIRETLAAN